MQNLQQARSTSQVKDDKLYPIVQITYLTRVGDAAVAESYGVHGSAPEGTACLLLTINGDKANRYVIPLSAESRTKDLKEGEFECGNFKVGSIITFDENGDISINAQNDVNIEAPNDVTVTAGNDAKITAGNNIEATAGGDLTVEALGDLLIKAAGSISIEALTLVIDALVTLKQNTNNLAIISGIGDVQSKGIDLATHKHSGVTVGLAETGPPA